MIARDVASSFKPKVSNEIACWCGRYGLMSPDSRADLEQTVFVPRKTLLLNDQYRNKWREPRASRSLTGKEHSLSRQIFRLDEKKADTKREAKTKQTKKNPKQTKTTTTTTTGPIALNSARETNRLMHGCEAKRFSFVLWPLHAVREVCCCEVPCA